GMSPYSAYLRVYEPLVAFREPARAAWALYSDPDAELPDPREVLAEEERASRRRLAATPPVLIPERESDQALVMRVDQTTYVCRLETRMRSVAAYPGLAETLPVEVIEEAVPEETRETAERQSSRFVGSPAFGHIRQARWQVPVAWFVLFSQAERRLVLVPEDSAGEAEGAEVAAGRSEEHTSELQSRENLVC